MMVNMLLINVVSIVFSFLIGVHYSEKIKSLVSKYIIDFSKEKPVYMIINARILDKEKLEEYRKVAVPLAMKAGVYPLAYSEPLVLQGNWPYQGGVVVERFRSLDSLKKYWYSNEYQAARKLLAGADERDFTIVIGDHTDSTFGR